MAKPRKPPAEDRPQYHELVATKLIEQLQAGTAPWQRPWEPGSLSLPHNPVSGTRYRGSNAMWLQMQDRGDPRWMTYKQAASIGAQVRKGEKGTLVQYWKFREEIPVKDAAGKPVKNAEGKPVYRYEELERPRVFHATVFNAEQIDGLPERKPVEVAWDRHERAEAILAASGAAIKHDQPDRAYYTPSRDEIHLPGRDSFKTADAYYATAMHELGHWTGHPSRLNRDLAHPFGSEGYAKEELRAEIASLMVGDQLQIGHDPGQHAAYVGSWIKALKDDPKEILRAARDADKIADYVMAFEKDRPAERPAERPAPVAATPETPARPDDTAGPNGPLDPAALADRLTAPQAADLRHLAAMSREHEGYVDKLRTGKRLGALGLVTALPGAAADTWRITPLGLTVADRLAERDKTPDAPPAAAAPPPVRDAAALADAELPAIPATVRTRLDALLGPAKEAQQIVAHNRATLGDRYAAEAWYGHRERVGASYARMGTLMASIPDPQNREAARRYLARAIPDRFLTPGEREWDPRVPDIEAPAWARPIGPAEPARAAETVPAPPQPAPAKPAQGDRPPAALHLNPVSGLTEVRDRETGGQLPREWIGIAEGGHTRGAAAFYYVSRWGNHSKHHPLAAADYAAAKTEASAIERAQDPRGQETPPAFLLTNNGVTEVRDYYTAEVLPPDWTGIAKGEGSAAGRETGSYWYIGRNAGGRSWNALPAKDYAAAQVEAAIVAGRERTEAVAPAAPPPGAAPQEPRGPARQLRAALDARDLKTAIGVLQPMTVPAAREAARGAGLSCPNTVKTKKELFQTLQPQLLRAVAPDQERPAPRPAPAPTRAGAER
jgi:antirestriction protein ArdC